MENRRTIRVLRTLPTVVVALLTFACAWLFPAPNGGPAPTPTGQIGAIEKPSPGVDAPTPFPGGHNWTGTIDTTSNADYGGAGSCTGEKWRSTVILGVAQDGHVQGTGTARVVAQPLCKGVGASKLHTDATEAEFSITGTFDGQDFNLTFNETSIDGSTAGLFNYALILGGTLKVPASSAEAAAATINVTRDSGAGTVNATHIVSLDCVACR